MARASLLLLALATFFAVAHSARLPRDIVANSTTEGTAPEELDALPTLAPTSEGSKKDQEKKDDQKEKYTSKFDNINLDEILKSDRLVLNYFKCLMDKGPCTADGAELKRVLPDALKDMCSKCSEKQRMGSEKVIDHMIRKKPALWKELQAKYDPSGEYKAKYEDFAKARGIKLDD